MFKKLSSTRVLGHQVKILFILQDLVELYNVWVPYFSKNLQLFLQSQLVRLTANRFFFNHLNRDLLVGVHMPSNPYLIKSSFSDCFPQKILSDSSFL